MSMKFNSTINLEDYRKLGNNICSHFVGMRLDMYLAHHFPFKSRKLWQKLIEQGQIIVNNKPIMKPSYRLVLNDKIFYYYPIENEPKVDENLPKIYEKNGVMLLLKPSGMPMHEGGKFFKNTFAYLIKKQYGQQWSAVHRIDKETSGLVLCANTPNLRKELAKMFENHQIRKEYIAIVFGIPQSSTWKVECFIVDDDKSNIHIKKWVSSDAQNGYFSQTYFETIDISNKGFSLIKAIPITGRTNQIRIHAAYSSHHLVGDKLYHPNEQVFLEFIKNGFTPFVKSQVIHHRLCLHAQTITFTHPKTLELEHINSPIPLDMQQLWYKLKTS